MDIIKLLKERTLEELEIIRKNIYKNFNIAENKLKNKKLSDKQKINLLETQKFGLMLLGLVEGEELNRHCERISSHLHQ